ncbi:hypothetical protein TNCV_940301 [Trichonephila clavipes]|nr:hypothetical protein TNCV_940301 [Trichonephila clavipes]
MKTRLGDKRQHCEGLTSPDRSPETSTLDILAVWISGPHPHRVSGTKIIATVSGNKKRPENEEDDTVEDNIQTHNIPVQEPYWKNQQQHLQIFKKADVQNVPYRGSLELALGIDEW